MSIEVIAICNHGYRDFTWNLSLSCQKQNIPLTIYTTDGDASRFLLNQGIRSKKLSVSGKQTTQFSQIFTPGFSSMCKAKLDMICQRIRESTADYLIYMDGDIAILKNFLPDIKSRLDEIPLLFQCDEKDLSGCQIKPCKSACTGFIAINLKSADKQSLLDIFSVEPLLWKQVNGLDQDYVNIRLKTTLIQWNTLPRHLYPNGVYFARNAFNKDEAFIIHFNYTIGLQKRLRMMKSGYWLLPIYFAS